NKGVSACAVCDGALFRRKPVCVVGGGDTAMEEAHYLSGLCEKVTLIHRRKEFRASQAMQDRVKATANIEILYNHVVDEVLDVSKDTVTAVRVRDVESGAVRDIEAAAMFVAIGHTPMTELV